MCGRNPRSARVQFVNAKNLFRQDLQDEQDGKGKQGIRKPPSARLWCRNLNSHPVDPVNPVKTAIRSSPVRLNSGQTGMALN
jgi:hypothetical protein